MKKLSLRSRLTIGFGIMLLLIMTLGGSGMYFIRDLSNRSSAMLRENYESVNLAKNLLNVIDQIRNQQEEILINRMAFDEKPEYAQNKVQSRELLTGLKNNLTEAGEEQLILDTEISFDQYIRCAENLLQSASLSWNDYLAQVLPLYDTTRTRVSALISINLQAIVEKNDALKTNAQKALVYITLGALISFIVAAWFMFSFPRNIAGSLKKLTAGIQEIANKNYELRLDLSQTSELKLLADAFNRMAARLDEFEHSNLSQLLFEKKRIDTIINTMRDAILGLNEKGEIIFSNKLACELFQTEQHELIGKMPEDLYSHIPVMQLIFGKQDSLSGKPGYEFSTVKTEFRGKASYFSRDILSVLIQQAGDLNPVEAGKVIILRNVTWFLEQDEAKTNFIATISHELKTPLSSMRLNLKLLGDERIGGLNTEQKDIIEKLRLESSRMLRITAELLDLSQVESGVLNFTITHIPLQVLVDMVSKPVGQIAGPKGVAIQYLLTDAPVMVNCDADKTGWVLLNLIGNAVEYSKEGDSVQVAVDFRAGSVLFRISDHGPGIDPQYHKKIFEKFFKVPGSSKTGTGLGLAICRELISRQKGEIWAEGKTGEGTTILFRLPGYLKTPLPEPLDG